MALPVDLSLEDYWRILKRRQWLLIFAFSTTFGGTVFYSFLVKPVYRSFATIKIEPPPGSGGIGSAFQTLGFNNDRMLPVVTRAGEILSLLIFIGYASIPAAILLGWIGLSQ